MIGYQRFGGLCCLQLQGEVLTPEDLDLNLHRREYLKIHKYFFILMNTRKFQKMSAFECVLFEKQVQKFERDGLRIDTEFYKYKYDVMRDLRF